MDVLYYTIYRDMKQKINTSFSKTIRKYKKYGGTYINNMRKIEYFKGYIVERLPQEDIKHKLNDKQEEFLQFLREKGVEITEDVNTELLKLYPIQDIVSLEYILKEDCIFVPITIEKTSKMFVFSTKIFIKKDATGKTITINNTTEFITEFIQISEPLINHISTFFSNKTTPDTQKTILIQLLYPILVKFGFENIPVKYIIDAIRNNDTIYLEYLLNIPSSKIVINDKDDKGWHPLHYAAAKGHTECVNMILQVPEVDVEKQGFYGYTPLHWAIFKGHCLHIDNIDDSCAAQLLKDPRVNINTKNSQGVTPLVMAIKEKISTCIQFLINNARVDVNIQDNEGRTALHWAAAKGNIDVISILLAERETGKKIDVNIQDKEGRTALHVAASNNAGNRCGCLKKLLEDSRVDVNIQDKEGYTALHDAVGYAQIDCIHLLLENIRVNSTIQDSDEKRPVDYIDTNNVHWKGEAKKQQIDELKKKFEAKAKMFSTSGGKPKSSKERITYVGKKYVVRIGPKGGKYILVGTPAKKIYL